MPFFDIKYLTNGYRYGHRYYRKRTGNHESSLYGLFAPGNESAEERKGLESFEWH